MPLPIINALYEDSRGDIWIGAVGGIIKYNRLKNSFKLFDMEVYPGDENEQLVSRDIVETASGDILFVGTGFGYSELKMGLYVLENGSDVIRPALDSLTNSLLQLQHLGNDRFYITGFDGLAEYNHQEKIIKWLPQLSSYGPYAIQPAGGNEFWLGIMNEGLSKFNANDSTLKIFPLRKNNGDTYDFIYFPHIQMDQNGNLLVSTNEGLFQFNTKNYEFSRTIIDPGNPKAMHAKNIERTILDRTGSIWITSFDAGLNKYNITANNFYPFTNNPLNPNSIPSGWINLIFEMDQNEIWFQSEVGFLTIFNKKTESTRNIEISVKASIQTILIDKSNRIWVGTVDGLYEYFTKNKKFKKVRISAGFDRSTILKLFEDSNETIWIGTYSGLYTFDKKNMTIAQIDFQSLGLGTPSSNIISLIEEDVENNIWLGSNDGLFKFNRSNKQFSRIGYSSDKSKSFSSPDINALYIDDNGLIWAGTWLGGLNSFDPSTGNIESFGLSDGLKSHSVQGILGDEENGALWLSTFNGISKFNLKEKTFNNFGIDDGVNTKQFADGKMLKTADGKYIFGGQNGFTIFDPKKIKSNIIPPKIILTQLNLQNKVVEPGRNSILTSSLNDTREILLNYDENDISIEYLAIHYVDPQKNSYAYRLTNYDEDWRYVGSQRSAIYPNLPPGEYIFQVKASNNNDVWNEEPRSLSIIIKSPPWATWWAYSAYFLLFFGLLYSIRKIELYRRKEKEDKRVLEVENQRKSKELEEARQLQLSMLPKELPNLSHLDIAVYMKTATEVGGDYYDFQVGLDGTLTVVIGDATGHGMKAGTMVTTTKGLFNVLGSNPDIKQTFHEMTRCLQHMRIEKLSMCMNMLKITGRNLQMSGAGMPPVLIYEKRNNKVEEYEFKGMPLGTIEKFPYITQTTELKEGDTILLMSDGFPELMNIEEEMIGFNRTIDIFGKIADISSEEIINKLKDFGSEWVNDKDPDDDVTFVVIKVK